MKASIQSLIFAGLMVAAPIAMASTYVGVWKNKTFSTTGALKIEFNINASRVTGSFDLDGMVFGSFDPAAVPINVPLKPDGSATFKIKNTALGDFSGSYKPDGTLTVTITNIPAGSLTEARIKGKFDLKLETFHATYEIDDSGSLFANGTADAHVPKAPVVKVDKTVKFTGKSAGVRAKVVTNTKITSFKAATGSTAKVTVTGHNPYQIQVSKISAPITAVTITVKNADGFTTRKVVKFIKNQP